MTVAVERSPGLAAPAAGSVLLAPLRIEAFALRGAGTPVMRTGMGADRAERAGRRMRLARAVVAGFGGGLDRGLEPGELVVATEVRGPDGSVTRCADCGSLVAELERHGIAARPGPIVSSRTLVRGASRRQLGATGAIAVDQESAWLAAAVAPSGLTVVRAIVDSSGRELHRPFATVAGGLEAYRTLARAAPVLGGWLAGAAETKERT